MFSTTSSGPRSRNFTDALLLRTVEVWLKLHPARVGARGPRLVSVRRVLYQPFASSEVPRTTLGPRRDYGRRKGAGHEAETAPDQSAGNRGRLPWPGGVR